MKNRMKNIIIRILEVIFIVSVIAMFVTGFMYAEFRTERLLNLSATIGVISMVTLVTGFELT